MANGSADLLRRCAVCDDGGHDHRLTAEPLGRAHALALALRLGGRQRSIGFVAAPSVTTPRWKWFQLWWSVFSPAFPAGFLRLVGSSHEVSEVSNNTTQEQNSCTNIKFNKGFEMRRTVVFSPRTRCAPRSRHLRRVGPPRIKMPRRVPSGGGRAVADSRFLRSSHAK